MTDDLDDLPDDPGDDQDAGGLVKTLRERTDKAIAQRNKAQEDAKAARTELVLSKSGLDQLDPVRQEALLKVHSGDMTQEALQATAVSLGFMQAPPPPPPDPAAVSAATQDAIAADIAGAGGDGFTSEVTLADVASWGLDRKRAFMTEHPDKWEALKRQAPSREHSA